MFAYGFDLIGQLTQKALHAEFSKSCLKFCQVPVLWNAAFQIMDNCKVLGLQIRSWKSAGCKPKETFCPTDVCSYWNFLLLSYYSCDGSILLATTFYVYGLNLLLTAIRSNFFFTVVFVL